jgi:conjugative transfer signal peptidase TraF
MFNFNRRGLPFIGVSAFGAALALAFSTFAVRDVVLYNPSSSLPSGFYVRSDDDPSPGAIVTVRARDVAPDYALARDFTDAGDRFLKRVVAISGDRVCASGAAMVVNQRIVRRQLRDAAGRALPLWEGCRVLLPGEVLLLGDTQGSFDGRYWGPIPERLIEGVWRPL